MSIRRILIIVFVTFMMTSLAVAQPDGEPLTVVGWNVEAFNGSNPNTIADRIAAFEDVDLWGLSEVMRVNDAEIYENAAEIGEDAGYASVVGSTGNDLRLTVLYDEERFTLVNVIELNDIQLTGRAPLAVHLLDHANQKEFIFMVNHLLRGNTAGRHIQAAALNEWAQAQPFPVIAVGDYNFDWDVVDGDNNHDRGFDNMTAGDIWEWIRPVDLVRTQCSASSSASSEADCTFNSVLDFVFVSRDAQNWSGESTIIVTPGDFPDNDDTSDHRPVQAIFDFGVDTDANDAITKAQLLEHIAQMEAELATLREMIEQLPE